VRNTLLLVGGGELSTLIYKPALEDANFQVILTPDARVAVQMVIQYHAQSILIDDSIQPSQAEEIITNIHQLTPTVKSILLCDGDNISDNALQYLFDGIYQKSWPLPVLVTLVRFLLCQQES
jgi:DNA-binding NarL/FixJ family response regulator